MLKMIDVLEQSLVQNFSESIFQATEQTEAQFHQELLKISDIDLANIVSTFFLNEQALEIAQHLDISTETIQEVQAGANLKDEAYITATTKIVAYCLAVETDAFNQVEVAECLQDYPM
ncbi:hypothetical protein D7V64_14800 [Acinetobacter cumulans]|uniref:Uncharacterized protein n=1 Tax=Acinetobacter cumulans TaxID=2136182 RepID=A0A3A8G753_9GAMM|nr:MULTISPECIES: hypothetical protein [Acinetobacter]NWK73713.1 hypothetical protein [Acinetobacter sp. SwsAc6]QCO22382.1 hypothetical protein C9E88_013250 [Acinetobacter cumulans]RFS32152.1 hypothetical protein DYI81_06475 [Acinetobacter sp. SWAC5]RKG46716.1 hypothetical protein D7V51_00610 [Acinetobacter cumulans]RKG48793.1 hypothetical protein D7V64_14800 [Acinetobacter cumulans]